MYLRLHFGEMFMHLRCALDPEHKARDFSVLTPLTLALSRIGEGIFRR
jgi:hypothetical protein